MPISLFVPVIGSLLFCFFSIKDTIILCMSTYSQLTVPKIELFSSSVDDDSDNEGDSIKRSNKCTIVWEVRCMAIKETLISEAVQCLKH